MQHTEHMAIELAAHAHPMQHDVHWVVFRATAGGSQSIRGERGAACLRGQAVLQPHVRGDAISQAAPIAAEPMCIVTPVERLRCGQTYMQEETFACVDRICLQISCVCDCGSAMADPATPYIHHVHPATTRNKTLESLVYLA